LDRRKAVALQVMETIEKAGYEAYLVGGCVRDHLLQKIPTDYDIATSARPEVIQSLFVRTVPTGLKHGTVTVLQDAIPIEVTTFRVEGDYQDHRRPQHVRFVSLLKEDLARRDFTFNAMAEDRQGKIIDYFSGLRDLERKVVRTVGDPQARFREDPLRMVRAARFANQFSFQLDPSTEQAMCRLKQECIYLSVERVTAEIEKIWATPNCSIGIELLVRCGLLYTLPPFYKWELPVDLDPSGLSNMDPMQDRIVRWAGLLFFCQVKPEQIGTYLLDLRLSRRDQVRIKACFALGSRWKVEDERTMKGWLLRYGLETVQRAGSFTSCFDPQIGDTVLPQLEKWWSELIVKGESELAIDGKELLEVCGGPPGPWIKQTLHHLLEQVALGAIGNDRSTLLKEGCRFGKSYPR
jgi:tRNA nucleotidyltransferase (CCA-adding enzyme)